MGTYIAEKMGVYADVNKKLLPLRRKNFHVGLNIKRIFYVRKNQTKPLW